MKINILPLEYELVEKLPKVGIRLRDRVYREQLESFAREDDEVNEMLGSKVSRNEYTKIVRGEGKGPKEYDLLMAIFGSEDLSKIQKDLVFSPDLAFKRCGTKNLWRIEYDVHNHSEIGKLAEHVS